MTKNRRKALRHFQSLLTRELGEVYEWNGIDVGKLTELLRIGMLAPSHRPLAARNKGLSSSIERL